MVLNARIALVSLVLGALLVPQTQTRTTPPAPVCHARPDLAGPCFAVHGALRYSNGGTPVKIWKIGTTRLLGVAGLGETGLPDVSSHQRTAGHHAARLRGFGGTRSCEAISILTCGGLTSA